MKTITGLFPFHENVKIMIPNNDTFPVVVNYIEQKLKDGLLRQKDAENGFFILEQLFKLHDEIQRSSGKHHSVKVIATYF